MHAVVRTFRAPDARSALAQVKAALGSDAIIVSTREIPGGLFRAAELEVTAALSDDAPESTPSAATPLTPRRASGAKSETPTLATAALSPAQDWSAEVASLRAALEEVREQVRERPQNRPLRVTPAFADTVRDGLRMRGAEDGIADELVKVALESEHATDAAGLFDAMRAAASRQLPVTRAPWVRGANRLFALVGPTGAGKTTTLAKIAARALMEEGLRVALVTLDTYRIGASEQVARYGEIMKVPTFVAKDRAELVKVIARIQDFDLVLIDTAGRSTSEAVAKQAEVLRGVPGVSLGLVLSLATGAREVAAAAQRYQPLEPECLLFTKLDEAVSPAAVLSAVAQVPRPIACAADGQRVPEDLHPWGTEEWVNWALGAMPQRARASSGRW